MTGHHGNEVVNRGIMRAQRFLGSHSKIANSPPQLSAVVKMARRKLSVADRARAVGMLQANVKQDDVAREFGVNQSVISRLLRRYEESQSRRCRECIVAAGGHTRY